MTTITFTDIERHARTPYSTLTLIAPSGVSGPQGNVVSHTGAIVDTGATVCQFPEELAEDIGIDVSQGTPINLVTAGGSTSRQRLIVDVEVFGMGLSLDVDFGPNAQPLIGRNAIEAALVTFGYTASELLYEQ